MSEYVRIDNETKWALLDALQTATENADGARIPERSALEEIATDLNYVCRKLGVKE